MEIIKLFEEKELTFEDFKNENWIIYWWASDMMKMLWYDNMKSFQKVLDRVTKAFVSLWIPHYENIIAKSNTIEWKEITDFKLTRFACYMLAMNGDTKKIEVAKAQEYFVKQTRKFELFYEDNNQIDRLLIREELKEWNKSLASMAKKAWVQNFASFHDAWYLWMYNMKSWQLSKKRWVEPKKLMDKMWRTELAANLFRITQTEERIKNKWIKGQQQLESTHYNVWKDVRKMVLENSWKNPENLEQEKELPSVRKELKTWYRKMKKDDKVKK